MAGQFIAYFRDKVPLKFNVKYVIGGDTLMSWKDNRFPYPETFFESIKLKDLVGFLNGYPIFDFTVYLFLDGFSIPSLFSDFISNLQSFPGVSANPYVSVSNVMLPTEITYQFKYKPAVDNFFYVNLFFLLTIDCKGEKLDQPVCIQVCDYNDQEKFLRCLSNFVSSCMEDNGILKTSSCINYLKNLYSFRGLGPDAEIDGKLREICLGVIGEQNIADFLNNSEKYPRELVDLCACHLPRSFYENLEKSVNEKFPNVQNLGIKGPCFVKQCVNSDIPDVLMNTGCNGAQCVNIVDFSNNGTIEKGNITINEKSECSYITGPTGPIVPIVPLGPTGPTGPTGSTGTVPLKPLTPAEKTSLTVYIILAIGGVVLAVVVVFVVIRKKAKYKR